MALLAAKIVFREFSIVWSSIPQGFNNSYALLKPRFCAILSDKI